MKVIAVFDIENDRIFDYSCDLHVWNEFGDVRLVKENVLLRPLPNRKEDLHYPCNEYLQAVNEGWNACIDEITGENE